MNKFFPTIIFSLLLFANASAQVSTNYLFSQTTGTYTAITGTTVTALGGAAVDDNPAQIAAGSIPFVFNYYGTTATVNISTAAITISPNGWICSGSSTNQGAAPLAFDFNPFGPVSSCVIAAFSADLSGTSTSNVQYTTTGVTPNRVFIIQWENFSEYSQSPSQLINFQIRLYETTNIIQVVYGSFSNLISTSTTPQVGLRGTTSTDYNARKGGTWDASIVATTNAQAMPYLNVNPFPYIAGTDYPVSGTTYIWSPIGAGSAPISQFSISDDSICPNTCITFNEQSTNTPTTWDWSFVGGNPSTSTDQDPGSVCYNTPGTYTVTLNVSNASGSNSSSQTVTVFNLPNANAGNDTAICDGSSIGLLASGGTTYSWSPTTGLSVSTGATPVATPTTSTTYTLTVTDANGCTATDDVGINFHLIIPVDLGNDTTICDNKFLVLDAGNSYTDYLWNSGNTSQTLQVNGDTLPLGANDFFVTVTDGNGCTSTDTLVVVNTPCSGIADIYNGSIGFQVYPNPASNYIILNYNHSFLFSVYNLIGEKLEEIILEGNTSIINISLINIPSGIYFCVLRTADGKIAQQKLVVQK
ncbi:MAG: PKD domain-containing protein [Bacteroidota bacterium]